MASASEVLRRACTGYIDRLERAENDPLIITALRSLVRQNSSTHETAARLWHDNLNLRADIVKLKLERWRVVS